MTLNTRQVSFYMAQRLTQEAATATTGISVRSGRRIEKGQWQSQGSDTGGHVRTLWKRSGSVICFLYSLPVRRSRQQRFSNICRINIRASIPIRCAGRCSVVRTTKSCLSGSAAVVSSTSGTLCTVCHPGLSDRC